MNEKYDLEGYCLFYDKVDANNNIIAKDIFKENKKFKVPVLLGYDTIKLEDRFGYAILEYKEDGVYAYVVLNHENYKLTDMIIKDNDVFTKYALGAYLTHVDTEIIEDKIHLVTKGDMYYIALITDPSNKDLFIKPENIHIDFPKIMDQALTNDIKNKLNILLDITSKELGKTKGEVLNDFLSSITFADDLKDNSEDVDEDSDEDAEYLDEWINKLEKDLKWYKKDLDKVYCDTTLSDIDKTYAIIARNNIINTLNKQLKLLYKLKEKK